MLSQEAEDVMLATADLVGRSGATEFAVGHLEENVPTEQARWWASAQYRGARLQVDEHTSPIAACDALAARLLTGARCTHCRGLVALNAFGAFAFNDAHTTDGKRWTAEDARKTRQCLWRRVGPRWVRGCERRTP